MRVREEDEEGKTGVEMLPSLERARLQEVEGLRYDEKDGENMMKLLERDAGLRSSE